MDSRDTRKASKSRPCPPPLCCETELIGDGMGPTEPSEALTLVANRFVAKTREWPSKDGQAVRLATYLFPEDAQLAEEYLDATARYLDAYIPLLGPYPFDSLPSWRIFSRADLACLHLPCWGAESSSGIMCSPMPWATRSCIPGSAMLSSTA